MADEEVGQTVQSPLQKYWNCSAELENLSLLQLYLKYRYSKGNWKRYERNPERIDPLRLIVLGTAGIGNRT